MFSASLAAADEYMDEVGFSEIVSLFWRQSTWTEAPAASIDIRTSLIHIRQGIELRVLVCGVSSAEEKSSGAETE
jgi:hypothetical protein